MKSGTGPLAVCILLLAANPASAQHWQGGVEVIQGDNSYRGSRFQGPPQPQTAIADRNMPGR